MRVELQGLAPQRGGDVLLLQDQDAGADALGVADADVLMAVSPRRATPSPG